MHGFEMVTTHILIVTLARTQITQNYKYLHCPACSLKHLMKALDPLQMNIKALQNMKPDFCIQVVLSGKVVLFKNICKHTTYEDAIFAIQYCRTSFHIGSRFLIFLQATNRLQSQGEAPLH